MIKKILTYDRLASKPYPLYELLLALPAAGICYVLYDYFTEKSFGVFDSLAAAALASVWGLISFAIGRFILRWFKTDIYYIVASYLVYFSAIIIEPLIFAFTGGSYSIGGVVLEENGFITLAGWFYYSGIALHFFIPLVIFLYLFSYYFSKKSSNPS